VYAETDTRSAADRGILRREESARMDGIKAWTKPTNYSYDEATVSMEWMFNGQA
jgi:hypothetical protein